MADVTIYFNSRCSKCRQTLGILGEKGIKPSIVYYLENNLSKDEMQALLSKLEISSLDLLRKGEDVYKNLKQRYGEPDEEMALSWMVENPILIERPIVVNGARAVVARPPERVLEII